MAVIRSSTSDLIKSLRKNGWTTQAIAKHLKMLGVTSSLGTIRRHYQHAVVEKRNRRQRKLTSQVMNIIDSILKMDDKLSARKVKELLQRRHNINISLCSVRKAIHRLGWKFGKARFVPMTRDNNKDLRLKQAQQWKAAGEKFDDVLFTDEAAFCVNVLQKDRCDNETKVDHLNSLLAQRTAEILTEQERSARLLAEKEALRAERDVAIASLKADLEAMRAQNQNLRQENQRLRETKHSLCQRGDGAVLEEMRAGFGHLQAVLLEQRTHAMPVGPIPRCSSTPKSTQQMSPLALSLSMTDSIQLPRQHADVKLREISPEDHARLLQQSRGQVARYGCLLFRSGISEENYRAWSKTTNWDGSKGKQELPQNVKSFVVETLKQKFPDMETQELRECVDKINEFLRTTRKSAKGHNWF